MSVRKGELMEQVARFRAKLRDIDEPTKETISLFDTVLHDMRELDASNHRSASSSSSCNRGNVILASRDLSLRSPFWRIVNIAAKNRVALNDSLRRYQRALLSARVSRFIVASGSTTHSEPSPPPLLFDIDSEAACGDTTTTDAAIDSAASDESSPCLAANESLINVRSRVVRAVHESANRRAIMDTMVRERERRIAELRATISDDQDLMTMHDDAERLRELIRSAEESVASQRLSVAVQNQLNQIEAELEQRLIDLDTYHRARMDEASRIEHRALSDLETMQQSQRTATLTIARYTRTFASLRDIVVRDLPRNIALVAQLRCSNEESQSRDLTREWPEYLSRQIKNAVAGENENREVSNELDEYANAARNDGMRYPEVVSPTDVRRTYAAYRDDHAQICLLDRETEHRYADRVLPGDDETTAIRVPDANTRQSVLETERLIAYLWQQRGNNVLLRAILQSYDTGRPFNAELLYTRLALGGNASSAKSDAREPIESSPVSHSHLWARFTRVPEPIGRFIVSVFLARCHDSHFNELDDGRHAIDASTDNDTTASMVELVARANARGREKP